jgi:type I restriction enzyme R subunit
MTPEQNARVSIDALLQQAGWHVCHMANANMHAARGVALREFPLNTGYGFADYLLYIDGKAAGVIEAKKEGSTLIGVEVQSARYTQGLPSSLPAWVRPLPFSYESTGIETHFTQGLDPEPRARAVFAFHRPETLAAFLKDLPERDWGSGAAVHTSADATAPAIANDVGAANDLNLIAASVYTTSARTFLGRIKAMPPLIEHGLWPAQIVAIRNLENSLKANKPRALIQMATPRPWPMA